MLKTLARRIPQIDRLVRQRDELAREVEQLRGQLATHPAISDPPPFDRRAILLEHLNVDGLGLEIGPSYNPLLPKSQGYRVESIDHADADHLRKKYRPLVDDVSRIEEVDHVSDGGSLFETIGETARYDYIVASHVIEHVPDLLGFLQDCEQLLKPDGRLSLAIPDKRYCFDVFQTLTTTGHALDTHANKVRRPTPGTLFDHVANHGSRHGQGIWSPTDPADPRFDHSISEAKQLFDRAFTTDEYMDAHVWRFVPSSFRLIVGDLNALGETSLRELSFEAPGGFEFFVTLSRDGAGCPHDRLALAKRVIAEQKAIYLPPSVP